MADKYAPPFGDYSGAALAAYDAAGVTALQGCVTNLKNLFTTQASGTGAASPDFNKIDPAVRDALFAELDAFSAAITHH